MENKEKDFEELMKNLEEITAQLESENLTLDKSVELFEKGMKISKECNEKLERIGGCVQCKNCGFSKCD